MKRFLSNTLSVALLCICIVLCAIILSNGIINRNSKNDTISVKGMAKKEFISDLAIWNVTISNVYNTLSEGLTDIDKQLQQTKSFLLENGIKETEIEMGGIDYSTHFDEFYDQTSSQWIRKKDGERVAQTITITSTDVDKVDQLSRDITNLVKRGVMLNSDQPSFYYTKLADLKLEMLSLAAEDARNRALEIAKNSRASVGKLNTSSMGVFQILGKYSEESYSWGGTFNTSSKEKVATVTVSSRFLIK